MSAIGPGDWVECVNARPSHWYGYDCGLVVGAVYQVRAIIPAAISPFGDTGLGLHLHEIVRPLDVDWGTEPAFCATRFRPVYRPKSELIQGLLQPILEDA